MGRKGSKFLGKLIFLALEVLMVFAIVAVIKELLPTASEWEKSFFSSLFGFVFTAVLSTYALSALTMLLLAIFNFAHGFDDYDDVPHFFSELLFAPFTLVSHIIRHAVKTIGALFGGSSGGGARRGGNGNSYTPKSYPEKEKPQKDTRGIGSEGECARVMQSRIRSLYLGHLYLNFDASLTGLEVRAIGSGTYYIVGTVSFDTRGRTENMDAYQIKSTVEDYLRQIAAEIEKAADEAAERYIRTHRGANYSSLRFSLTPKIR